MNAKLLLSSLAVTSLLFISCKKELEPQESTATSELVRLGLAKDTTKAAAPVVQNPAANPNTVLGATKGINPPHGQPGHRCDIAVGAPLNSAPTQQGQATAQTGQTVQVNQPQVVTTTVPAKTPKGMNPPPGQPGHRCDIPVGAALNSPPAKTTATTTNTGQSGTVTQNFSVTPPPASNPVPALLSTEETEATVADGMNPPHGKPGHRCDIAVGAPLPK